MVCFSSQYQSRMDSQGSPFSPYMQRKTLMTTFILIVCLLLWIGIGKSVLFVLHMEDSSLVPGTLLVGPAQCKPEFCVISIDFLNSIYICTRNQNLSTEKPKRLIPFRQCLLCCRVKRCKREPSGRV